MENLKNIPDPHNKEPTHVNIGSPLPHAPSQAPSDTATQESAQKVLNSLGQRDDITIKKEKVDIEAFKKKLKPVEVDKGPISPIATRPFVPPKKVGVPGPLVPNAAFTPITPGVLSRLSEEKPAEVSQWGPNAGRKRFLEEPVLDRLEEQLESLHQEVEVQKSDFDFNQYNKEALLMKACQEQPYGVLACIRAGSDVNARDADGRTPLMHAALGMQDHEIYSQRDTAAITMLALIEAGADITLRDKNGKTAYDLEKQLIGQISDDEDFDFDERHLVVANLLSEIAYQQGLGDKQWRARH